MQFGFHGTFGRGCGRQIKTIERRGKFLLPDSQQVGCMTAGFDLKKGAAENLEKSFYLFLRAD
jgi:hypothetical protein